MKKLSEDELLLEQLRINGMEDSYRALKAQIDAERNITSEDILEGNSSPISEYHGLTDQMKEKIKKIMESMKENKEVDDRDEKDTLDEKEGKEELSEDKKKEFEEKQREKGQDKEENDEKKDDSELEEDKKEKDEDNKTKKEETPKKDDYLAELKRLHKMKIVDYKEQLKSDRVDVDRYFITMMALERRLNRQRASFIKEYGSEELIHLENEYIREEQRYKKTLNKNMENALFSLRQLDEKLDSILDRMQDLQKYLEDGNISLEEYNDEINALEKDKLDTLWQINKLNPELLEEKQENIELRRKIEARATTSKIEKEKNRDLTSYNKSHKKSLESSEKKQEGVAKDAHQSMKENIEKELYKKEKRINEIQNEISGIDISSPEGKKRAWDLSGEYQTLLDSTNRLKEQYDSIEKNMGANVQSYADLREPEEQRRENVEKLEKNREDLDPEKQDESFIAQIVDQVKETPETPERAQEVVDDMNKIAEEAKEEQESKEKENDETEPPTLWNRRKKPF